MPRTSNELRDAAARCFAELGDVTEIVRAAVRAQARRAGLPLAPGLRLFRDAPEETKSAAFSELVALIADRPEEAIGQLYESILDFGGPSRKRSGSFYTPPDVAARVVEAALGALDANSGASARACDPALGGGVFLLALGRALAGRAGDDRAARRRIAERVLHGVDVNPLAVAVAEAALWLWVGDPDLELPRITANLKCQDALERGSGEGFDLVIGNPPWVAYAGRAAQPLAPETRARWAREFRSFFGYRTLHGLFVERAAELAPRGVVALILPSPIADLAGYAPVRRTLAATHTPVEPMLEFGQDAFENVVQPCFALVAAPGADPAGGEREWRLIERQRARVSAEEVAVPRVLERIGRLQTFPKELFGEMGFQSSGNVSKTLFLRQGGPDAEHTVPLLEGRDVGEFRQRPPRLYLNPDPEALARARCRLRAAEQYRRVAFVVRQTAKYPIAALHGGLPFRNTLLAGFELAEPPPALVVALLNSVLYRGLHLARRRDARQAVFPQVKIAHLRAMPRPPDVSLLHRTLARVTECATRQGMTPALRGELDQAVCALFEVSLEERAELEAFVRSRAPELELGFEPRTAPSRAALEPRP
jgi:methylase of polypeptide subunit release factors